MFASLYVLFDISGLPHHPIERGVVSAFDFTLADVNTFPGMVYLAPNLQRCLLR